MPLLKLREYARHRAELRLPGATHGAVQKAIKAGRIHIDAEGRIDAELADQEWASSTDAGKRTSSDRSVSAPVRQAVGDRRGARAEMIDEEASSASPGMSLADAAALEKVWNANLAELKYRKLLGELVGAKDLSDRLASLFNLCRTKVLGATTQIRQQMPELSTAQIGSIDKLLREALEDLSVSALEEATKAGAEDA